MTIRTNTGEAYLVRDRATPDGGRVMVFTDITDKFRAETALAEQKHALADADAQAEQQKSYLADLASRLDAASASVDSAKTTLLRTMGHELKTPLNAILGFSRPDGDPGRHHEAGADPRICRAGASGRQQSAQDHQPDHGPDQDLGRPL